MDGGAGASNSELVILPDESVPNLESDDALMNAMPFVSFRFTFALRSCVVLFSWMGPWDS